jgi:glutathione S-transferase
MTEPPGCRVATPRTLLKTPNVVQRHACVAAMPKVSAYLRSPRRVPFSEKGIFRRYPELDIQL